MMQPTDSQDNFRLMPCQDGSLTIHSALHDQCFHSSAGALLESQYIYLELGLKAYLAAEASTMKTIDDVSVETIDSQMKTLASKQKISVLEIGFGSGINALLCALEFEQARRERQKSENAQDFPETFYFESIELYPIPEEIWSQLDYASLLANEHFSREEIQAIFEKIHRAAWNERCEILPDFFLHKRHEDILTFEPTAQYQVVFSMPSRPTVSRCSGVKKCSAKSKVPCGPAHS